MSGASQFKRCFWNETTLNQRTLSELFYTLRRVDELNRLLEIRVEELERVSRIKYAPKVIDGRDISVLIDDKWGESR